MYLPAGTTVGKGPLPPPKPAPQLLAGGIAGEITPAMAAFVQHQ